MTDATTSLIDTEDRPFWPSVLRGWKGRCPSCGQGPMLRGYLKVRDTCPVCGEAMHHHRAEHWIVVKGTAEITNGDQVILLSENQSTYIPQGQTHRLANPGKTPLEIIEVQSGSYLGEDDIVRFEDTYGRS